MSSAGNARGGIERTLRAAYAGGLLSDETFDYRLDEVLSGRLLRPRLLVGDLSFREATGPWPGGLRERLRSLQSTIAPLFGRDPGQPPTLLALAWDTREEELLLGRHERCDIVLTDPAVSRRHARLSKRDGRWVLKDLCSRNGSFVNGARVGRCELRPGDRLRLGDQDLLID